MVTDREIKKMFPVGKPVKVISVSEEDRGAVRPGYVGRVYKTYSESNPWPVIVEMDKPVHTPFGSRLWPFSLDQIVRVRKPKNLLKREGVRVYA